MESLYIFFSISLWAQAYVSTSALIFKRQNIEIQMNADAGLCRSQNVPTFKLQTF